MIEIRAGDGCAARALPHVNLELRLFRRLVVAVADEREFRLFFIPSQLLIFPFAGKQRDGRRVALRGSEIDAVRLFIL